ncbi:MAG: hypothetical protein ACXVR1_03505 [Solirubrobacteraceae bacterium]
MTTRRINRILLLISVAAVAAALAAPTVQAHVVRGSGPAGQAAQVSPTKLRNDATNRQLAGIDRNHPYSVTPDRNHPYGVTTSAPSAPSAGGIDWVVVGILAGTILLGVIVAADINVRRRGPLAT